MRKHITTGDVGSSPTRRALSQTATSFGLLDYGFVFISLYFVRLFAYLDCGTVTDLQVFMRESEGGVLKA